MPAKGYRKGATDAKTPLPISLRTRLPLHLHSRLVEDAALRRLTVSRLVRAIVAQHYQRHPIPRMKSSGPSYAIARELNRIGVNLNQLAHLANAARIMSPLEIRRVLDRITAILERL